MNTATFRDLGLGQAQGTLVESPLSGFLDSRGIYRREWAANCLTYIFFAVSTLCLCYASVHLYRAKRDAAIVCDADAKEALIGQNDNNEYDDH